MTAVLAARQHWCRQGERILWMREHSSYQTKYDVDGLDEKGNPRKSMVSRALRATAIGVVGTVAAIDYLASDDDAGSEGGATTAPIRTWIFGSGPDCLAARAARPWTHRNLPGWVGVPGWWTLTPGRFAFLTTAEAVAELAKGEKGLLGNAAHLTAGVAMAFVEVAKGEYPAGKPVEFPEMVPAFEFDRNQISGIGPVVREESRKDKPTVLRVSLVDGSGFDLEARGDILRFTSGG
ncbi:hypothetical protein Lesp02_76270 [Lentzea sp. NBRC 105346]|uniref:hypothetical protein n=1 Tax=Lentzea sp. NBRC 105346 TaxID=3032205 RepID=UPI00249FF7FD|nr:hypothetical protein [Lentzea sp. NBRC 105346]GLZ35440.1 hypothetical protein Lesp02_76270 [Lentzea sp. NBRC 105346]